MREFLKRVEISKQKEIISISELARSIRLSEENPTEFKVKEFDFPIISGLISTREMIGKALGIKKTEIITFINNRSKNLKEYIPIKTANFVENKIIADENTPLDKYIPLIDFYGGRRYTTSSIVITKFSDENRQNASFHRMMYLGGNRFSIRIVAQRHLDNAYNKAMENDSDLNVAIIFGVHPAIEICAAYSLPQLDELQLAASFLGELEVFKLSNGIFVPAESEFVIEGRITKKMAAEGPFIDLTMTLDHEREQPILEVDKLYFKDQPIFRTILPGGNEHRMLMGIPQEPRMYNLISNTISTVKNVVLTQGGCCWLHGIVQIKKRTEGDAKNAILAALAAHPSLKRVIIVDDDIDITNINDVEWAIATRVQPDKDIILIPNSKGSSLDPSSDNSITCKWGIDATKPLENNKGYNKVEF